MLLLAPLSVQASSTYADGDPDLAGDPDGIIKLNYKGTDDGSNTVWYAPVSNACPDPGSCNGAVNSKQPGAYSLVWSDEFDGSTLAADKWSIETGYGNSGWGNDEWQLYTNSPDNVSVQGGNLVLSARSRCASPPNCGKRDGTITSGKVNTLYKFAFKYGKVEARIKPPVGTGTWPAFWMLGSNFPRVGWPFTGEIDIVEMFNLNSDDQTTHFTMHFCDDAISGDLCQFDPGWRFISQSRRFPFSLGDDFHVFSAEWDADGVTGKIDDIPYFYLAIDPRSMDEFLKEFYMILNVAIGGTLGVAPDTATPWPQTMLVDYVRVYQAQGGEGTYTIGAGSAAPAVYSETRTAPKPELTAVVNSVVFGGNATNTDLFNTAVPAYEGAVALAADFINTGSSYGGFLFEFIGARDMSPYHSLRFAIDSSAMANFANLTVQIENFNSAQPAPQVFLADYTPVSSNGNWNVYEIPLLDLTGQAVALDLASVFYLGFWNARSAGGQLQFGTLYFDDIHLFGSLDSDGDGLSDAFEILIGTSLFKTDTDEDGLSDYEEVSHDGNPNSYVPGQDLNPLLKDTDGDGFSDYDEVNTHGTDPLDKNSVPDPTTEEYSPGLNIVLIKAAVDQQNERQAEANAVKP